MTWNKLKLVAALGLTAGLTVGGAGAAAQYGGMGKGEAKPEGAKVENPPSGPDRGGLKIDKLRHDDEQQLDLMIKEVKSIEDAIPDYARQLEAAKRDRDRGIEAIAALKKKLGIDNPADLATSVVADPEVPATLAQIEAEIGRLRVEERSISQKVKELNAEHEKQVSPLLKAFEDLSTRDNALSSRYGELLNRGKKIEADATQADLDARIKRLEKQVLDQAAVIRDLKGGGDASSTKPGGPDPAPSAKPTPVEVKKTANSPQQKPAASSVIPMNNGDYVLVLAGEADRVTALNTKTGARSTLRLSPGVSAIFPQIIGPNFSTVGGLTLEGPEVRQVAAFDYATGKWYPRDLQEPTTSAVPIVGSQHILYPIGRFFYVFRVQTKTWSILELKSDPGLDLKSHRDMIRPYDGKIIIPEGDLVHLFDTTTGEWTHINTKDDK